MTLFEAVTLSLRRLHYSPRTEEAYLRWIREFVRFHNRRHPREMGAPEITAFLNHLAVNRHTSASTQNQALCALVFLYRKVLELEMPALDGLERARRPEHLPNVLSPEAVRALLEALHPPYRLLGELLYGSGLRLQEVLSLRIKDIDLQRSQITVRRGKGAHDRPALLPASVRASLAMQIESVRRLHGAERDAGRGEVSLPEALRTKMPAAATSFAWQFIFPASRLCADPVTGRSVRYHLHESALQKAIREAATAANLDQRVTCHTLRHSFATHLLESGTDIRTIQTLLGHKDVRTTMVYTHIVHRGPLGVVSPLDR